MRLDNSVEYEKSLLAGILLNGEEVLSRVISEIRAEDFGTDIHRRIYEIAISLYERDKPIEIIEFYNKLPQFKDYLSNLLTLPIVPQSIDYYVQQVKEFALKRRLSSILEKYYQKSKNQDIEVYNLLQDLDYELYSIFQRLPKGYPLKLYDILSKRIEYYDNVLLGKEDYGFIKTGYKSLDNIINGLAKKTLTVIAGRPGMGKTALALNIALNTDKILFFSLEMSKEELADRVLAITSQKALNDIRWNIQEKDLYKLVNVSEQYKDKLLFIDDNPNTTLLNIKSKSKMVKHDYGLDIIIVDYLQLLRTGVRFNNRAVEVDYISRELKGIAKDLDVCVVALSQLNRNVEQRNNKRPDLSDLKESGGIEQNADVVMLLYRDEVYNPNTDRKGMVEVNVAKHRQGKRGIAQLGFWGEQMKFVDWGDYQIYYVGVE